MQASSWIDGGFIEYACLQKYAKQYAVVYFLSERTGRITFNNITNMLVHSPNVSCLCSQVMMVYNKLLDVTQTFLSILSYSLGLTTSTLKTLPEPLSAYEHQELNICKVFQ